MVASSVKKTLFRLTHCLLAVLLSTEVHGQNGDWYVAPAIVYTDADDDRNLDDLLAGGQLRFGRPVTERITLEGLLGYSNIKGSPAQKHWDASFNVLRFVDRDNAISPYLLIGAGYLRTDPDNALGDNRPTANLGIGFTWVLGDGVVSLRAEHRARVAFESNNNQTDRISTLGVQFSFGGSSSGIPVIYIDTDRDGVADRWDQCPATALGIAIDDTGCEIDSDGDGVVNNADVCPETPAGMRVHLYGCLQGSDRHSVSNIKDRCLNTGGVPAADGYGCERDDDSDKVFNRLDQCPNTAAGVRVDVNGCEIRDIIALPGVNFASNVDRIFPGAEQVLADAAATLNKHPDLVVEVAGHTDSDGSDTDNEDLSERRANTVRNHLINAGADAAKLSAKGYGEAKPIADNATAQGKAANRRVELRILNR